MTTWPAVDRRPLSTKCWCEGLPRPGCSLCSSGFSLPTWQLWCGTSTWPLWGSDAGLGRTREPLGRESRAQAGRLLTLDHVIREASESWLDKQKSLIVKVPCLEVASPPRPRDGNKPVLPASWCGFSEGSSLGFPLCCGMGTAHSLLSKCTTQWPKVWPVLRGHGCPFQDSRLPELKLHLMNTSPCPWAPSYSTVSLSSGTSCQWHHRALGFMTGSVTYIMSAMV